MVTVSLLACVKLLSYAIQKPVALAIVMPGLPFSDHCGPFLITAAVVLDFVAPGGDPRVLMYEPLTKDWSIFDRLVGKSNVVNSNTACLSARKSNAMGQRLDTARFIESYKVSPNFFAFKSNFRQLLLWTLHTNEVYEEEHKSKIERVYHPNFLSNSNPGRAARGKTTKTVALEAYNYLYIKGGELKGLRVRTPREF